VVPKELFAGLTVLELSSVLAGPLAGSFFAELGAKVTKVENKRSGGDITRQWKLPEEDPAAPAGAYYHAANYGKKAVFLDFQNHNDRQTLDDLIKSHDIILTNFQKKVAVKFNLEPAALHERYPEKIIIQLDAYDYDDPRPGFDLVMQAETGFISMNGTTEGFLCKMPVALIDILASHQIREAALIALLKKEKTGKGSLVHVSLYRSGIASLANQASNYLMAGRIAKPMGTLHPNIAPYGDLFYSADKVFFMLAVGSDHQFEKLWKTLNFSETNYVNFVTNFDRLRHRADLQKELQTVFSQKTFENLQDIFGKCDVPYAEIKNMAEVFENPLSREMILEEKSEKGQMAYSVSNIAFRF
jgi:crotonobetainyl-CoA:carnitine CoA-transferase CaiB-like acyl-CoA transferase